MDSIYTTKSNNQYHPSQTKIVLDYSFCNSSNFWNYIGLLIIPTFITVLFRYLENRIIRRNLSIYLFSLIILGLIFVIPFMCWSLKFVEIVVTFIRYGEISSSPLSILSMPIEIFSSIYMKILSIIHWYLSSPGTFVFLLFFIGLRFLNWIVILIIHFRFPAFYLCSWIGLAIPLYALTQVGQVESWIDFVLNIQLPLFFICKYPALIFRIERWALTIFLILTFFVGYFLKFGLTFLFFCKSLFVFVLLRFTYVIGKAFIVFVFFTAKSSNAHRKEENEK